MKRGGADRVRAVFVSEKQKIRLYLQYQVRYDRNSESEGEG